MEPLKTTGVVLKATKSKNSSLALSVLSPDLGKISIWARGVRGGKNTQRSGCALLTYSEFVLLKRGEMYTLIEATPLHMFYHLREDVLKLAYGVYFAELAGLLFQEGMECAEGVRLLLNTLHYLEKDLKDPQDLKVLYEIRIMCAAGFMPFTDGCVLCGNADAAAFSPKEGGLVCRDCSPLRPLPKEALALLRGYTTVNLKQALEYPGTSAAQMLADPIEQFVRHHTDLFPKSLEYLYRLKNTMQL